MEPVLTPEQMRAADAATISRGVPEAQLMDRAAHACAVVALRMLGGGYGRRVTVVAGKGNNGGDGIVCARHLERAGVRAAIVRTEEWSAEEFARLARRSDLVVDAIFGTGFSDAPIGAAAEAIRAVNSCGRAVLAVDIPSGVSGADGSVPGQAVRADVTVAIQALKVGHLVLPGALYAGRIDVCDIGIATPHADVFVAGARDVRGVLPEREADTHKYRVGALAVLAGSTGMTGAAILTARAAVRAGAGMVVLGVPSSSLDVFENAVIEAIKVPLPEIEGQLDAKAVDEMADRLERCRALAVGPGLGRGPRAVALVKRVLEVPLPLVVDGDGLWALGELLGEQPRLLGRRAHPTVLTPHEGEFAFLAGRPPAADRVADVRALAAEWAAVVHLKGRRALTASPQGEVWINTTGIPEAATAGSGDVLTGIVGALVAAGVGEIASTWAGAHLHGLAAGIAAGVPPVPFAASDIVEALPRALRIVGRSAVSRPRLRTVLQPL